ECLAAEQPRASRHVDERSSSSVVEQAVLADTGNENVRKAIIVVIADCNTHPVHLDIEASAAGHVSERSIAIVAIKLERTVLALVSRPIHAIHEQYVGPTIGVVVDEGATSSQSLGKKLAAKRAAIVMKI